MQTPLFTWQRILLTLGKLVLTACLAVELAVLFWRVVAPMPLYLMPPSTARGEAQVVKASSADFHLFGIVGNEPVAEVKAEDNAPDTLLSLDLLGVTVTEKPERSSAIIAPRVQRVTTTASVTPFKAAHVWRRSMTIAWCSTPTANWKY